MRLFSESAEKIIEAMKGQKFGKASAIRNHARFIRDVAKNAFEHL